MTRHAFRIYEFAGPVILLPLAWWLWTQRYEGSQRLVFLALFIPILVSYVVPAVGTNWFKVWEINTPLRLGRFRPQHGFLFGTVTSLIALACLAPPSQSIGAGEILRAGFVLGSVLAFWNWLYDIYAIKADVLRVYTRAYYERRGAEAIATEYAPVFFGVFGFCYGVAIRLAELVLLQQGRADLYWPLLLTFSLLSIIVPVSSYIVFSFLAIGESGLRSYEGVHHEG